MSPPTRQSLISHVLPVLAFAALVCVLFWRCLFLGEAFVPADQLRYIAPWSEKMTADSRRPAWNPLHYDSVGQFYCWSEFAARTTRHGRLPLWNPHQLCGTPYIANSQSAVYYPPNVLRTALGAARAAGWLAALHLLIAATFTYAFLRRLGLSATSGFVGGLVYSLSTWQIAWLHLPTFAASSCWLPAILLAVHSLRRQPGALPMGGLAASLALPLLAGHLQIAFYVILCAAMYALWLLFDRSHGRTSRWAYAVRLVAALCLAVLIAAPQLLPASEMSARSHRMGRPSQDGFAAYTAYAVHPAALATLMHPDLFGSPANPEAPYFGFSKGRMYFNYAEGALYVGLLPLLLAAVALIRFRTTPGAPFATVVAVLALSTAMAGPLAMVLYFGVPGFSQSGSPGRILVLWAFAVAWLAATGAERFANDSPGPRSVTAATIGVVIGLAAAVALAAAALQSAATELLAQTPDLGRQLAIGMLAAAILVICAVVPRYRPKAGVMFAAIIAVDLLAHNATYNSSVRLEDEMGHPAIMDSLRRSAGHDRIAPINANWSFMGPKAVLPPNLATLYGLRDVQGYDSLLPGQYKRWLSERTGADPSPPEVGNMVFLKTPDTGVLDATGARVVVSRERLALPDAIETQVDGVWLYERTHSQGRAQVVLEDGRTVPPTWIADEPNRVVLKADVPGGGWLRLADQRWPGWKCTVDGHPTPIERADDVFRRVAVTKGARIVEFRYEPATTRVGHYLMLAAMAFLASLAGMALAGRRR